ncbi:MAG: A24 family peptidase [Patescibacteria group bacterium]
MTPFIFAIFALCLGLIGGAVVNSFVMRTPTGLKFTVGRSCSTCASPLRWQDHLPLVSYITLASRCSSCRAVHPLHYLFFELTCALLALVAFGRSQGWWFDFPILFDPGEDWLLFVRDLIISILALSIFLFDYKSYRIPDILTVPGIVCAIILNLSLGANPLTLLVSGLAVGSFFALQFLISHGLWIGAGDVRLGLLTGFTLGPGAAAVAVVMSYIIGAITGGILISTGKKTWTSYVPYGTFLTFALIVSLYFGEPIANWYSDLWL